jgi:hypothetical protein
MAPRKVGTPGSYNLAEKSKKSAKAKMGKAMKAKKKKAKMGRPTSASKRGSVRKGNYRNVILVPTFELNLLNLKIFYTVPYVTSSIVS